jgi:hypothetical protein
VFQRRDEGIHLVGKNVEAYPEGFVKAPIIERF